MDPETLAQIAAQLAGRVRDDDPEANARWLEAVCPDPADWFRLAFVLAAAVPVDIAWSYLTAWTQKADPPGRALKPHGTIAAAQRHRYRKEPPCEPCSIAVRERDRQRRRLLRHPDGVPSTAPTNVTTPVHGEAA